MELPRLTIQLFGQPGVYLNEHRVKFRGARTAGVLYYCLDAKGAVEDGILLDLFWPNQGRAAAKRLTEEVSLINSAIRKELDNIGISESSRFCMRDQGVVTFEWNQGNSFYYDVAEFESEAKRMLADDTEIQDIQALEQVCNLYQRGPFLGTFHLKNVDPDFDTWISQRREELEELYRKLLMPLSVQYMAQGAWAEAIDRLESLLEIAPEEEAIYGLMMVCHAVTGNITQVEDMYRRYEKMMELVLHHEPNNAIAQLYQIIRTGQFATLTPKALAEQALQINHRLMQAPLQVALSEICKVTGIIQAPNPNADYYKAEQGARDEAARAGSNFVGVPHLFLALCVLDDGTIRSILESFDVNLDAMVRAFRFVMGEAPANDNVPSEYTLTLQHIFDEAHKLSEYEGAETVGTSQLWRSLFRQNDGVITQVFSRYGIDRAIVTREIEEEWM